MRKGDVRRIIPTDGPSDATGVIDCYSVSRSSPVMLLTDVPWEWGRGRKRKRNRVRGRGGGRGAAGGGPPHGRAPPSSFAAASRSPAPPTRRPPPPLWFPAGGNTMDEMHFILRPRPPGSCQLTISVGHGPLTTSGGDKFVRTVPPDNFPGGIVSKKN